MAQVKNCSIYYFDVTDVYSGSLNYSHLTRIKVTAKTVRGALYKISKYTGLNFTRSYRRGIHFEFEGWVSKSGATGLILNDYEGLSEDEIEGMWDFVIL